MDFGYFTLSDNAYPDNPRSAEEFVLQIRDQAIYADQLGMHSAWIGEHHFDTLGVNSMPSTLLASIIPVTRNIRFAPAVCVLPFHHPIRVAEEWATLDLLSGGRVDFAAGRGYDRREYAVFGVDYMKSLEMFNEQVEIVLKAWNTSGKWSHQGQFFTIPEMEITPKPIQQPLPFYIACFSRASMEIAGRRGLNIVFAPFAAAMTFGGLDQAVDAYRAEATRAGHAPKRAMCSYFIHIAETPEEEDYGRRGMMDYFNHCVLPAFPSDPEKMPPTMQYFMNIVDILKKMKKQDLTENSILLGSPQKIIDRLKEVESYGICEVILYFNVGNKPHAMVKDQMAKFMEEIAPHFDGQHKAEIRQHV